MKRKLFFLIVLSSLSSLGGCSFFNSGGEQVDTPFVQDGSNDSSDPALDAEQNPIEDSSCRKLSYTVKDELSISPYEEPIYAWGESAALIADGIYYGTLGIRQVELLGIWDWYNSSAIRYGVRNSYSFNLVFDLGDYLSNRLTAKIVPTISLVDSLGGVVGSACSVGWSGFDEQLEVYQGDKIKAVEVGMQPYTSSIHGDYRLKIELVDTASDVKFDTVYYDITPLKHAKQGAKLRTANDLVKLVSICGAEYQFSFTRIEDNLRADTEAYYMDDRVRVFDINYVFEYLKKPDNNRGVTRFDSFTKNKANPELSFYLVSSLNDTKCTTKASTARIEKDYQLYDYVTPATPLGVGQSLKMRTNLVNILEDSIGEYVRIVVEFPEERAVRTDDEMLDFDGRYVIYQLGLSEMTPIEEEAVVGLAE